ncbi:twin-arginine translocase TatA/TatE family subunit [Paenibacillus lautus]|uniref:twin-arginine translocase TatA/TatE family subunit n=1 Tax=Paenibacillus lautus TaxID=1401 RepID=UPI003D27C41D
MLSTIGIPGLLLFGPSKLPQLGRAVGATLHEFRSSARHLTEEDEEKQDAGRRQEDH